MKMNINASKIILLLASILIISVFSIKENEADVTSISTDKYAREIERVIDSHEIVLSQKLIEDAKSHKREDIITKCETLTKKLKNQELTPLKPTLITNEARHKKLNKYKMCNTYKHNDSQLRRINYVYKRLDQIGTHSYRLFNVQHKHKGEREIIYAETNTSINNNTEEYITYAEIDINKCMFKSKKRSGTRGPYDSERTLISTIVSNDEFYILDLSKYMGKYDSKLKYRIRLWGVGSSKQNLNSLVCKFDVYGE